MLLVVTEQLILVASLSLLGGIGSYLQNVRDNKISPGFLNLLTELTLSLIVGLTIAYLGHSRNWNPALVCALALVLSNNGSDTLLFFKELMTSFIKKFYGTKK